MGLMDILVDKKYLDPRDFVSGSLCYLNRLENVVTQLKESNLNNNNNNNNRMKIIQIYRINITLFQKFVSFADRASQCNISN